MTGPVVPTPPAEVPQAREVCDEHFWVTKLGGGLPAGWSITVCEWCGDFDGDDLMRQVAERVRAARDEARVETLDAICDVMHSWRGRARTNGLGLWGDLADVLGKLRLFGTAE